MTTLILLAVISTALVAGIFYAFSTFIMQALLRLDPREGIKAMQSINVVVLNPLFFAAFFGAGAASIAAAIAAGLAESSGALVTTVVGAALYLIGCIGVTAGGNVPLNEQLKSTNPTEEDAAQVWANYGARWTKWNHVRTAASLAASIAFALAAR